MNNLLTRKKTALDVAFNKYIVKIFDKITKEDEDKWETYNTILEELATQGRKDYIDEIKYRLTEYENPNVVFSDVLSRDNEINELLFFLKRRVDEYLEDDLYKRFY